MKKILYTMSMAAAAILFTSCAEDKGTSSEVADANQDEPVKPSQIRAYGLPGTAGNSIASMQGKNNQSAASTNQPQPSAVELVTSYYTEKDPVEYYRTHSYKFSATQRMGGKAADTSTAKTSNMDTKSTNMAPGSTTADAQGRDAVTSGKKSTSESKSPATNKDKTGKKKTRLTPHQ